jgi:orotidine-5'-phosphate decarboxylase
MHFADRLEQAIKGKGNPICVGLDPRFDSLPAELRKKSQEKYGATPKAAAEAFLVFNKAILDAVADLVPICKPQVAFYEELGWEGLRVYAETIAYARGKGILVISDAKRGDIGTTAQAYAQAHLGAGGGSFNADALTVNPYMGPDTLEPFLKVAAANERGLFILVKTSNPGSGDLQDQALAASGAPLYERVALMVHELGRKLRGQCGLSGAGAVVGATYPKQARRLRELMPETFFLIPGYGAQGGAAADAAAGFRPDGRGAIVNSSRGIIFAYQQPPYSQQYGEKDFAGAARAAVLKMAEELKGIHG